MNPKIGLAICGICFGIDIAMGWWLLSGIAALGAAMNLYTMQRTS